MMTRDNERKEPIRIAQIIGRMCAGGVEMVVFNYYRSLDKSKVQFDFFFDSNSTVEPPQDLIDMGARFYKIPAYKHLFKYLSALKKIFKDNKYEIVHSHMNTLSVFSLYAAKKSGVPIRIAHNHSVPGKGEFLRNLLKNVLRIFSKVYSTDYFACSEKAGRWMYGNAEFDKGNVRVVKNAVDFEKFANNIEVRDSIRGAFGLSNQFVVGHIGRFTFAKNHMFLLDSFQKVLESKPDSVLILVGDGELRKEIVESISIRGLNDKVILAGSVSNPQDYYQAMDVVLLPSVFEGLSLTTIESQLSGTPIVVSEAVPDEAIISDGCIKMKLSEGDEEWAKSCIVLANKTVKLDKRSDDYNIHVASNLLLEWYLTRLEKLNA